MKVVVDSGSNLRLRRVFKFIIHDSPPNLLILYEIKGFEKIEFICLHAIDITVLYTFVSDGYFVVFKSEYTRCCVFFDF